MNTWPLARWMLALGTLLPVAAHGQTIADFRSALSGEWQIVDSLHSASGKTCLVTLSQEAFQIDRFGLATKDCSPALKALSGWNIVDGQIILFAADEAIAALGGNQRRLSGNTAAGEPIILDRPGADPVRDQIAAARQSSGCYYLGFTSTCADESALDKPAFEAGSPTSINVLVNLNAREEARDDAAILGVVPQETCVVADICVQAADGVWCRATFGEKSGWLKKVALRQQKWPVVTFVNQCPVNEALVTTGESPSSD